MFCLLPLRRSSWLNAFRIVFDVSIRSFDVSKQHENLLKRVNEGRPPWLWGTNLIVLWTQFTKLNLFSFQLRNHFTPKKKIFLLLLFLDTSNKSQSSLPYQMIPLPSEYITKRASQFSECLFFVPSWIYARRGQKCWLQRCNWKNSVSQSCVERHCWARKKITPCRIIP